MTTDTWTVTAPQVIDIDAAVTKLSASIVAGRISVVSHEQPGTRIEVTSITGRDLRVQLTPQGELVLDYPFITWDNPIEKMRSYTWHESVDIAIAVPREAAASVTTVSGHALLAQLAGDVRAKTVSGQMTLDDVAGDIDIKSVSGPILGRDLAGSVGIDTVSGEVTLSGEIGRLSAHTVSAAILLDTLVPDCDVRIDTVSGNTTVRRPAAAPVAFDVAGFTGRVVIDGQLYQRTSGRLQVGDLNAASGLRLRVKSMSGTLTVLATDDGAAGSAGTSQGWQAPQWAEQTEPPAPFPPSAPDVPGAPPAPPAPPAGWTEAGQ